MSATSRAFLLVPNFRKNSKQQLSVLRASVHHPYQGCPRYIIPFRQAHGVLSAGPKQEEEHAVDGEDENTNQLPGVNHCGRHVKCGTRAVQARPCRALGTGYRANSLWLSSFCNLSKSDLLQQQQKPTTHHTSFSTCHLIRHQEHRKAASARPQLHCQRFDCRLC